MLKAPYCGVRQQSKNTRASGPQTELIKFCLSRGVCSPSDSIPVNHQTGWLICFGTLIRIFALRASEAAAQCIVIGPVCLCVCVCGSVTTITRKCAHRSSPNWVCR